VGILISLSIGVHKVAADSAGCFDIQFAKLRFASMDPSGEVGV
jgi:hypothetical protein